MPIAGQPYSYVLCLLSADEPNRFRVNPTLEAGDVQVSTDFGAPVNILTLPTVIGGSSLVLVTLAAAEVGSQTDILFHDVVGDEWADAHTPLQASTTDATLAAIQAQTDLLPASPAATGDPMTLEDVDGVAFADYMESILAALFGVTAPSGSSVEFKKRDGSTGKLTILYGSADGERLSSVIA